LEALLASCDGVLMDLRSFSRDNAGCIFELEQIVSKMSLDRIVLVCDSSTDLRLLGSTLDRGWEKAMHDGCSRGSGAVGVVHVQKHSRRELCVLMERLLGIAEPTQVVTSEQLARI
jgi:hypothetical protein